MSCLPSFSEFLMRSFTCHKGRCPFGSVTLALGNLTEGLENRLSDGTRIEKSDWRDRGVSNKFLPRYRSVSLLLEFASQRTGSFAVGVIEDQVRASIVFRFEFKASNLDELVFQDTARFEELNRELQPF